MEAWLEAGRIRPGQKLPSSGELCASLSLTAPTLRKAMARLVSAGIVEPLPRGWRAAPASRGPSGMVVALLRTCAPDGSFPGESDREGFFRHALELEGARRGIRIEAWGLDEDDRLFRSGRVWEGRMPPEIHGAVVSLWHVPDPIGIFARIRSWNLPLAIWDERSQGGVRPTFHRCRWFQSAHAASSGSMVARHLLDLNHRGIAFLSPFHGASWSRSRLEGLSKPCASSTNPVKLSVHTRDDRWDPSQYTPAAESVRSLFTGLALPDGEANPSRFEEIVEKGQALLREREILRHLEGLFVSVLEDRSLTAWVGANDDIALLAGHWLALRGVRIGRDVSLAGFDNSTRAQASGLTTVSFLEEDLAAGMIAFLLDPGRWRSNGSVVLEGSLVARTSTTRAPTI